MTTLELTPTPEQSAIISAVRDTRQSVLCIAGAGCSKTTVLTMAAPHITSPAIALAFNVKIRDELQKRFPANFEVKTFNGLGHRALMSLTRGKKINLEDRKVGKLVTELAKRDDIQFSEGEWEGVMRLVNAAMSTGLVPSHYPARGLLSDSPANWQSLIDDNMFDVRTELIPFARAVLIESISRALDGEICYNDQIYIPTLFGGSFPRFPVTFVDEVQDLSPLNHLMLKKVSAGRIIAVGDPRQAIYAFRGADHESIDKLRALRDDWIELPLMTTFRVPRTVVERQQRHAPGFTAAPQNSDGQIVNLRRYHDSGEPIPWEWSDIPEISGKTAVLCRNNAPLLSLAFKLIRQGHGVKMLGTDIGKGLVALAKRIIKDPQTPAAECITLVHAWMEEQISLARANENEHKISSIEDRGACLLAVLESGNAATGKELGEKLSDLFARDRANIELASIHRAKGLEWPCVVMLDPWRIPSKYAKKAAAAGNDRQLIQEYNLRYVGETRTKEILVFANMEQFQ